MLATEPRRRAHSGADANIGAYWHSCSGVWSALLGRLDEVRVHKSCSATAQVIVILVGLGFPWHAWAHTEPLHVSGKCFARAFYESARSSLPFQFQVIGLRGTCTGAVFRANAAGTRFLSLASCARASVRTYVHPSLTGGLASLNLERLHRLA